MYKSAHAGRQPWSQQAPSREAAVPAGREAVMQHFQQEKRHKTAEKRHKTAEKQQKTAPDPHERLGPQDVYWPSGPARSHQNQEKIIILL